MPRGQVNQARGLIFTRKEQRQRKPKPEPEQKSIVFSQAVVDLCQKRSGFFTKQDTYFIAEAIYAELGARINPNKFDRELMMSSDANLHELEYDADQIEGEPYTIWTENPNGLPLVEVTFFVPQTPLSKIGAQDKSFILFNNIWKRLTWDELLDEAADILRLRVF